MAPKHKHGGAGRGQRRKPKAAEQRTQPHAVYLTEAEWLHCSRDWCFGVSASFYVRRLVQQDMCRVAQQKAAATAQKEVITVQE